MGKDKKTVLIGISGGIAVYKIAYLVRIFKKSGWNVIVMMTENATKFVAPLTFQTLSENHVVLDTFKKATDLKTNMEHINLSDTVDLFILAPATANIIGKIASGIADDIVSTTVMALKKETPKIIVPAMNVNMYENPVTIDNIAKLKRYGYFVLDADEGDLACGVSAKGRMPEPEIIFKNALKHMKKQTFKGKKILVTAGATIEPIDPVRFITNHSSGKMGIKIAEEFWNRGAEVFLLSGIYAKKSDIVSEIKFTTVDDLWEKIDGILSANEIDYVVMAAAISDYKTEKIASQKIKKGNEGLTLPLVRTKDITMEIKKKYDVEIIGFAAETEKIIENAKKKIIKKGLKMIVANNVTEKGAGFGVDTNHCYLIDRDGNIMDTGLVSKSAVAERIADFLEGAFKK